MCIRKVDVIVIDGDTVNMLGENPFDARLDSLYGRAGIQDIGKLLQSDLLTVYRVRLKNAALYLEETAADFEEVENELMI